MSKRRGREPKRVSSSPTKIPPAAPSPPPPESRSSSTRSTTMLQTSSSDMHYGLCRRTSSHQDQTKLPSLVSWMIGGNRDVRWKPKPIKNVKKVHDKGGKDERVASISRELDAGRASRASSPQTLDCSQAGRQSRSASLSQARLSVRIEVLDIQRSGALRPVIFDMTPSSTRRSQSMPPLGSRTYQSHDDRTEAWWKGNEQLRTCLSTEIFQASMHRCGEPNPTPASE